MKLSTASILAILLFLVSSCKKYVTEKEISYTITGKLVESSSNPLPVRNYTLGLSQKDAYGLLSSVNGVSELFKTGENGEFSVRYTPKKSYGLFTGAINQNYINLSGGDTLQYKNLSPNWYPISPNKDIGLDTLFLFKRIDKLVRKVQFDSSLKIWDSLQIYTLDVSGSKSIFGPVAAGSVITVDTLKEYKAVRLDLITNTYYFNSSLRGTAYLKSFNLPLPLGDEVYREQLLIYP